MSLRPIAQHLRSHGIPPIPADWRTKATIVPWKHHQTRPPTEAEVDGYFTEDVLSMALLMGKASGGMVALDFERWDIFQAWLAEVEEFAAPLPMQRTPRGAHVCFRRADPGRSTKLAAVPDASEDCGWKGIIETRAEGGYILGAPSKHPSGEIYKLIQHDFPGAPMLDDGTADFLLDTARSFNQVEGLEKKHARVVANDATKQIRMQRAAIGSASGSVISNFNFKFRSGDVLGANNYAVDGDEFWRPGKSTSLGSSGIIARCNDGVERSVHFSTNDVLNDEKFGTGATCGVHDAFDAFCLLEMGGDMTKAVREAARLCGMTRPTFKDAELITIAMNDSDTGEYFQSLFLGNIGELDIDTARSELAKLLRVHTDFTKQIDRIVAKSALKLEVAA